MHCRLAAGQGAGINLWGQKSNDKDTNNGDTGWRQGPVGKKVVLFAVPGAFTPTCSVKHLPGFVQQTDAFKAKGYDVVCLAVNDPFVMQAWGRANNVNGKVFMLPDGNAAFTKALGLEMDGSGFGLGTRSQRFAMVVEDGVVRKLAVEAPGAFEVSSADAVMKEL
jgi:peroxiredoxin